MNPFPVNLVFKTPDIKLLILRGKDKTKYFSKEDVNILFNKMHYLKHFTENI